VRQGSGDADALQFTAGEVPHLVRGPISETNSGQGSNRRQFGRIAGRAAGEERDCHVVDGTPPTQDVHRLEHPAERNAPQSVTVGFGDRRLDAVDEDRAGCGSHEQPQNGDEGGLSRAWWPHHGDGLAVVHVEVDAIEHPRTRAVPHRDVAQTQGHDGELRTSFGLSRSCSPASSPEVMWTLAIRPPSTTIARAAYPSPSGIQMQRSPAVFVGTAAAGTSTTGATPARRTRPNKSVAPGSAISVRPARISSSKTPSVISRVSPSTSSSHSPSRTMARPSLVVAVAETITEGPTSRGAPGAGAGDPTAVSTRATSNGASGSHTTQAGSKTPEGRTTPRSMAKPLTAATVAASKVPDGVPS